SNSTPPVDLIAASKTWRANWRLRFGAGAPSQLASSKSCRARFLVGFRRLLLRMFLFFSLCGFLFTLLLRNTSSFSAVSLPSYPCSPLPLPPPSPSSRFRCSPGGHFEVALLMDDFFAFSIRLRPSFSVAEDSPPSETRSTW